MKNITMKKIAFAVLWLLAANLHAQTLYQVEIIVFARDSAEAESEENWDQRHELRYPAQTVALAADDGSATPFQLLPPDALALGAEAAAIRQRRNLRVLAHMGWLQTVEDPARARHVLVRGGRQFGTHYELEGSFALGVEHFLVADANLWLSRFAAGENPAAQPLPVPPGSYASADSGFSPTQTVVLQEQRRMRSGELHYFDHPKMGLLVLATRKSDSAASAN